MTELVMDVEVAGVGRVPVRLERQGSGRAVLVLHGGAGPSSVAGLAATLAAAGGGSVIVPTHPGFDGTTRPDALASIGQLAETYAALLAELGLEDVLVIGNSVGGWIA